MKKYQHETSKASYRWWKRTNFVYFVVAWNVFGYAVYRIFKKKTAEEEELASKRQPAFNFVRSYLSMSARNDSNINYYDKDSKQRETMPMSQYLRRHDDKFDVTKVPK